MTALQRVSTTLFYARTMKCRESEPLSSPSAALRPSRLAPQEGCRFVLPINSQISMRREAIATSFCFGAAYRTNNRWVRRNDASTGRDPLAFELRVQPSIPHLQPHHELHGQTLAGALRQVNASVTVSISTSISSGNPVTTCVSILIPAPALIPTLASHRSSPPVAVAVSVTMASPPAWRPRSLEEFLASIERTSSARQRCRTR